MIGLCTRLLAGVFGCGRPARASPIEQSATAARIFVTGAGARLVDQGLAGAGATGYAAFSGGAESRRPLPAERGAGDQRSLDRFERLAIRARAPQGELRETARRIRRAGRGRSVRLQRRRHPQSRSEGSSTISARCCGSSSRRSAADAGAREHRRGGRPVAGDG